MQNAERGMRNLKSGLEGRSPTLIPCFSFSVSVLKRGLDRINRISRIEFWIPFIWPSRGGWVAVIRHCQNPVWRFGNCLATLGEWITNDWK